MPDVAPLQSADPTQVAGYRLTGRIGAGGQGVVYLGVSPDNELVAVKMLRVEDERSREQFAKEVASARRVAPFCTAQILDFDMQSQPPYVISEFIEGPSLQQYVSEHGPMSGTRLQRLAIGTATALAAIHQAGVVHRDLKPANVMMSPEGPRVIDFGIARDLSNDTTKVSKLFGTPAYMSPEQLRGERVGPATDLFAWGSVMAFAATGRAPFEAEHMMAAITKIAHEEPDLTGVPPELLAVLRRCFSKDAAYRPTAQQALSMLLGRPDQTDAPDPTVVLAQATQLVEASTTGPTMGYAEGRTAVADAGAMGHPVAGRRPTGTSGPVSPGVPSADVPPWGTPAGSGGRATGTAQGHAPSAFQQGGQYSPPSTPQPQQYQPPAPSPQPQWGAPGRGAGGAGSGFPSAGVSGSGVPGAGVPGSGAPGAGSNVPGSQHSLGQHGSGTHGSGAQNGTGSQSGSGAQIFGGSPDIQRPAPQNWQPSPRPGSYPPPQPQQPQPQQWGPPGQQPAWNPKNQQGQQSQQGLHGAPNRHSAPSQYGAPGQSGAPGAPGAPGQSDGRGQSGTRGQSGAPGLPGVHGQSGMHGQSGTHGQSDMRGQSGTHGQSSSHGQRGPLGGPQPPMPGPAQRAGNGGPALPPPGGNGGWNQPPQAWGGSNGGRPGGVPGQRPGTPAPNRGRFAVLTAVVVLTLLVGVGLYNLGNQGTESLNDTKGSTSSESGGSKDAADPEACGGRINVGADQGDDSACDTAGSGAVEDAEDTEDAAVEDGDKQAAAGTLPYELAGSWEGEVTQYSGTVTTWTVRLDLKGGKKKPGTMEAVDLGCRSKVSVTSVALTTVILRAPVKESDNKNGTCAPLGEVILLLDPTDPDKATFTWQDKNNAANVGYAELERVD
ncbi:hypothetical protein Kisp01_62110 [Kineosporia sp. NBRC 101677]|uniref:serine/threonine protein kinase n=1 Tax=Kineosporia sp. NBRC 101677 TaxID=3032197 RepID=UPI0024A53ABF|nr:serine/threonine-protein kinase [Kineosporia sp. NBRC 101677]GLY19197.1 hypothetical protein Kisp01_62110 [Kineosporia sp. NBRC 101677]